MKPKQLAALAARNIGIGKPVEIVLPARPTNLRKKTTNMKRKYSSDGVAPPPPPADKAKAFFPQLADGLNKLGFNVEPDDVDGIQQAIEVLAQAAGLTSENAPPPMSDDEIEAQGMKLGLSRSQIAACQKQKCSPKNFLMARLLAFRPLRAVRVDEGGR